MEYTLGELLSANLARTFHDHEVGFTGLGTGRDAANYMTNIPVAAMELARHLHAPNLTLALAGWSHNPDLSKLVEMPDLEFSKEVFDLPCEAKMLGYPGLWSHRIGDISFGFCSGAQVDREGNINSVAIGDWQQPKVQLIGPAFLPEHFACFGREYIMMAKHDKRSFVEKVDFVSGVGYPGGMEGRRALGLSTDGPKYIFTPKCIFSFDEEGKIFVLSIHPHITKEELIESTGFDLGDLSGVPVTPAPTEEELYLLRNVVDPTGLLLGDFKSEVFQ